MKNILSIIKKITISIFIISIILIISCLFIEKSNRSILGYSGFIVLSDSMKVTDFDAGDLIIIKKTPVEKLKEGDIISYISQYPDSYMDIITHKIRNKTFNESGEPGFITYGTTTNTDDEIIVTYPYIIGKYQFCIPKIGILLQFIKTIPGYIIFVAIPFLTLITIQASSTIKEWKEYKENNLNEIKKEREELEKERQNIEKMMEELQKLKNNNSSRKRKKKKKTK